MRRAAGGAGATSLRVRLMLATAGRSMPFPVRFLSELVDLPAITAGRGGGAVAHRVRARRAGSLGADAGRGASTSRRGRTMLWWGRRANKSILLQTFVTSLLLANAPDELNLVLVDFKVAFWDERCRTWCR